MYINRTQLLGLLLAVTCLPFIYATSTATFIGLQSAITAIGNTASTCAM